MRRILLNFLAVGLAFAQPAAKAILGTISGFKAEAAEVVVKPDNTDAVSVKMTPNTIYQRVSPGEKDLKKAETMKATDIALGDRVLVTFEPGTTEARRILVMSATDISKRNEADRLDWTKRGISGVVAAKQGNEITLKMRSLTGEIRATVTVEDKTAYRRYSADSVKFADAHISRLDEVNIGDQLRARGEKSEDGSKVTAEEVVFGTFVTKAGTITAMNAEAKEITITDLTTKKPLVIKLTADSQIKKMPNMAAMFGAMPGGGMPGGAAGPGRGVPGAAAPAGGRMPDIAQMLERMPASKIDDLKEGEQVVVSSTKGADPNQVTAITLLGNANMLIQMATTQPTQKPQGQGQGMNSGMGGMSMGGGLDGLNLPGIVP